MTTSPARAPRMTDRLRVLVTDAEVRKTLAVVRDLTPRFEVWTAASSRPALAAWSRGVARHLRSPSCSEFPDWLVSACREHQFDVLICPQERSLLLAGTVYEKLGETGVALTFPRPEVLDRAFDKAKTLAAAERLGVPAPTTRVPERHEDTLAAANDLGFPLVLKPRYSTYRHGDDWVPNDGTQYASNASQLEALLARFDRRQPPPLLQQYVPGRGFGVFLLRDRDGEIRARFAHRRLRDVRPTGSGSVVRKAIQPPPEMLQHSLALVEALGLWGVSMVEFKHSAERDQPILMEVNGRFWGSLQLALDAGVDFPGLLVDMVSGAGRTVSSYAHGGILRWWLGDALRALRVLRGKPENFPGPFPSRLSGLRHLVRRQPAGTRSEVFRASDPWPGLAELLAATKRIG